jgi:hypothetical protein
MSKVIKLEPKTTHKARDIVTRWGGHAELLSQGFVPVPATFLKNYASLKPFAMTSMEAMLVLQLMLHKWDADDPYPGYKSLAKRLGKTEGYARTLARTLEGKRLLARVVRVGRTNRFNLRPLFDKLKAHLAAASKQPRTARKQATRA